MTDPQPLRPAPPPPYDGRQPTLEDAVARLRPVVPSDQEAVLRACQDPESQRWTTIPVPYEPQHALGFVTEYAGSFWAEQRGACWAMSLAGSDDFCGALDLRVFSHDPQQAEVGFNCAPWARGRGMTTAAVGLACRWGFEVLGLDRIEWQAQVGNEASRRVADKAGFRFEGTQRAKLPQRGERHDCWVAGLLPADLADSGRLRPT